ncbi:hypothetical protein EW146_g8922 [Bondarzewia mesenterica]|uniref:Chromosome segregation in meiosis protein n=1 Tax=Bondarzewia mesenterica TaxID=1095465 RepID=A0A4S4LBX4_9AGAM|nr:hypothetical protein EW146_g8922 [Bondarzewia mesenterica]
MAAVALEDIWDVPAESSSSIQVAPISVNDSDDEERGPRKPKQPLFLPSDGEDEATTSTPTRARSPAPIAQSQAARPDIDALFDDAFEELAPALDLEKLQREADARNARAIRAEFASIVPSQAQTQGADTGSTQAKGKGKGKDVLGDEDEEEEPAKKKRKPIPRLDEPRLLGKDGFPQLMKNTQHFKTRGKGHEAADLDSVLQIYQFWTHRLYSKTKFRDSVQRIEKLCHSKRMHVALSVWRDESKGLIHGKKFDDEDTVEISDDEAGSSTNRITTAVIDVDDSDDAENVPSSRPPSQPPSTSSPAPSAPADDFDLEALIAEEQAFTAAHPPTTTTAPTPSTSASHSYTTKTPHANNVILNISDEDEAMWDALDMDHTIPPPALPTKTISAPSDDDEDMWDLVREMEQEQERSAQGQTTSEPAPAQNTPQEARRETNDEGWDDMYL